MRKLFLPLLAVTVLDGCTSLGLGENSNYSCPGIPQGIVCKSPREVYQLTNGQNYDLGNDYKGKDKDGSKQIPDRATPFSRPQVVANSGPMPVLEPSQVLRVWIGPWQDEKKDLHWPSYVFTEITPKKWSFGGAKFNGNKPLVPVQADFINSMSAGSGNTDQQGSSKQAVQLTETELVLQKK